jgi:O-antigen/teichoic acid export membrane protein
MAGQSWPILFSSFINVINIRMSILIVAYYFVEDQVGIYGFASRIAETIGFLAPVVIQPIVPILSQKYNVDKQVFFKIFKVTVKFLLIAVIPVIVFLVIELDEMIAILVRLFLKTAFLDSIPIAKILIVSQTFMFCFSVFNRAIIASYNQFYSFIIITVSVILNIVLHVILIPKFGLYGAAAATFVSISFFLVTSLFFNRTRWLIIGVYKSIFAPVAAGLLSGLLLYYLDLTMWLTLPLTPTLFFMFLYFFRGLKREELEYIYEVRPTRFIRWLIDRSK